MDGQLGVAVGGRLVFGFDVVPAAVVFVVVVFGAIVDLVVDLPLEPLHLLVHELLTLRLLVRQLLDLSQRSHMFLLLQRCARPAAVPAHLDQLQVDRVDRLIRLLDAALVCLQGRSVSIFFLVLLHDERTVAVCLELQRPAEWRLAAWSSLVRPFLEVILHVAVAAEPILDVGQGVWVGCEHMDTRAGIVVRVADWQVADVGDLIGLEWLQDQRQLAVADTVFLDADFSQSLLHTARTRQVARALFAEDRQVAVLGLAGDASMRRLDARRHGHSPRPNRLATVYLREVDSAMRRLSGVVSPKVSVREADVDGRSADGRLVARRREVGGSRHGTMQVKARHDRRMGYELLLEVDLVNRLMQVGRFAWSPNRRAGCRHADVASFAWIGMSFRGEPSATDASSRRVVVGLHVDTVCASRC